MFQYINAFTQVVEEEIGSGIFHLCVISETVAPTIARKRVYRFEAGATLVFQLNKVHGTVQAESKPGHDLITYGKLCGIRQRLQRFLSVGRNTLYKEFLIDIQLTALLLHIGYGRQVLRINGSPRDTRIPLLYGNGCRLQFSVKTSLMYPNPGTTVFAGESVSITLLPKVMRTSPSLSSKSLPWQSSA